MNINKKKLLKIKNFITFRNIRRLIYWLFICYIVGGMYLLVNPLLLWTSQSNLHININEEDLKQHVQFLVDLDNQRSYDNTWSLNIVSEYIYDYFVTSWCDNIMYQRYKIKDNEYKNIICSFEWNIDEKVIIWAHYDVYWEEGWNYKWADDNASWISWLLELSRLIWTNTSWLTNSIELVAYTLEEPPYFRSENMWSYIHAKSLYDNGEFIKYMISLETIWYYSDDKIQEYPIKVLSRLYPSKANFIAIIWQMYDFDIKKIKKGMLSYSNIDVWSLSAPSFVTWVDFSDHMNYWKFWYKWFMITDTAFFRNKYYHTDEDTIDKLDFSKMKEVVKWVYWLIKY